MTSVRSFHPSGVPVHKHFGAGGGEALSVQRQGRRGAESPTRTRVGNLVDEETQTLTGSVATGSAPDPDL